MTNLAISTVCNQRCAYCFTVDHLPGAGRQFLPLGQFQARLNLLNASGMDSVRLLGGEPTLHPHFPELIEQARQAGKKIVVFTNGRMPDPALASLEALPAQGCTVVVNVNEPEGARAGGSTAGLPRRQRQTLARLKKRAMPGFNIYRTDFCPDFLLDLIAESGCRPAIRLSMAQPALSGRNQYIHPNQYRAVATRIVALAQTAAGAGVRLEFDCGFVRCMFSDDEIQFLRQADAELGWHCNPIPDIDVEGNVLHCYPLASLVALPLPPDARAAALRGELEARTRHYRQAGVFAQCSTCPFKQTGECSGGCLAMTIRRFRHTPFHLQVPAGVEAAP